MTSTTELQANRWVVDLPYRKPPLSQNDRLHWAARMRIKDQLESDTIQMARFVKLPKGLLRVAVELHYRPGTHRKRRDEDNLASTLKVCCDAMVKYGLCPDDSHEFLTSCSRIDPVCSTNPGLYLVVYRLEDS